MIFRCRFSSKKIVAGFARNCERVASAIASDADRRHCRHHYPLGIGLALTLPLLSLRMTEAGCSAGFIGVNSAVGGLTSIVSAPLVPGFARLVGTRRLLPCSWGHAS